MKGKGIYTQPKRNAYKINLKNGQYGKLIIDVPILFGQLHLIAKYGTAKVIDKKVDFDTIDLLTKRFNSSKKCSPLSNRLSEIPMHKTSQKYKKIGAGVVYYNNVGDLLDRIKLLGGIIMAGNNGVKDEFSHIVHKLNELSHFTNKQLGDLLKEYVM